MRRPRRAPLCTQPSGPLPIGSFTGERGRSPESTRTTSRATSDFNVCMDSSEYQAAWGVRSEEHTSELQSRQYLVCRLLLEKKKQVRMIIQLNYSTTDIL